MKAISRDPRSLGLALLVALVLLFVALRLAFLRADPPLFLPNGLNANELFVEPAAKAHEARNMALFGVWRTSPADNYQFWRIQSPLWVYPLSWWLRWFGVTYAALRTFAVFTATLGFVAFLALAARGLGRTAVVCAAILAAVDFYFVQFTRVGLIEPLVLTFLTLTVYALVRAKKDLRWLLVAEWALTFGFLTKQTALFLLPLTLGLGIHAFLFGAVPPGKRRAAQALVVANTVGLTAGLVWFVARPGYLRTVAWNYGHMLLGGDGIAAIESHRLPSILRVLARMVDVERIADWFFFTLPVTGALAVVGVVRVLWRLIVRRDADRWAVAVSLWLASGWAALLLTDEYDVRFRLILFPPAALMAAHGIEWLLLLPAARRSGWLRNAMVAWFLGAFLRINAVEYVDWAFNRKYVIPDTNASIRSVIGARPAVVVGLWAPPLTFETPYVFYYVKNDFNATRSALDQLGITHALIRTGPDWTRTILKRNFLEEYEHAPTVALYYVRATVMTLYDFHGALGAKPPRLNQRPRPMPPDSQ